jgi:hypothetical protein
MDARPLSDNERDVLGALLDQEAPGATELRDQLGQVEVVSNCNCGCGSIAFTPRSHRTDRSSSSALYPVEGEVLDDDGNLIGGVLLFVRDGRLNDVDVYSVTDRPLQMPDLAHVRWVTRP